MDPYVPVQNPTPAVLPPPGKVTIVKNIGGQAVIDKIVPSEAVPKTPSGISAWTSSSWVTAWLTRLLGAIVVVISLLGWAVPQWFQGIVDDPAPLGAAIATLVGIAMAVLGEIGKRGRENGGIAASPILKALLLLVFLSACASQVGGSGPNYGKLDPADPNTAVIMDRERTTFACEQYVASTAPFRRQQRLHLQQPDVYKPVDPLVWEGITQLRATVGETCADPQGQVTVDMATIPPAASDFITNFILTGRIR